MRVIIVAALYASKIDRTNHAVVTSEAVLAEPESSCRRAATLRCFDIGLLSRLAMLLAAIRVRLMLSHHLSQRSERF
jgi:hypothetical protein